MEKIRLDKLLVDKKIAPSRERARSLILAGNVIVNEKIIDKVGTKVDIDSSVRLIKNDPPYVSRGGLKLSKVLDGISFDIRNKIAMDVGASTGGFTDCMLQRGVKKVYAVDVGYGQLAWSLRRDKRVIVLERKNIRYLKREEIKDIIDLATIDVSFISLRKVIPRVTEFLREKSGVIIALIKPQFEVGKGEVGKGGIVRDEKKQKKVIEEIATFSTDHGFTVKDIIESPITGVKGNKEFFIYLTLC